MPWLIVPAARPAAGQQGKLAHVCVIFQGEIVGDLNRREVTFREEVDTIYGQVSGWSERVVATRLEPEVVDRRPRSPRVTGDVDHQIFAPVPVDLGRRHPLPVDVARLHRVLGEETRREGDRLDAVR